MQVTQEGAKLLRKPAKQKRSRDKVELILATTLSMLDEGPADSITTNEIAKAAGISIGTLYQFFSGKEAVFFELYDQWLLQTLAAMDRIDERFNGSEGLPAYSDAVFEVLSNDKDLNSAGHWQLRYALGSANEVHERDAIHHAEVRRRIIAIQAKFGQRVTEEEANVLARLRHRVVVACLAASADVQSDTERKILLDWCRKTIHLVYDVEHLRG